MYKANLNHALLDECLRSLLAQGLIEETRRGNNSLYKTTLKGLDFLIDFKTLKAHLG